MVTSWKSCFKITITFVCVTLVLPVTITTVPWTLSSYYCAVFNVFTFLLRSIRSTGTLLLDDWGRIIDLWHLDIGCCFRNKELIFSIVIIGCDSSPTTWLLSLYAKEVFARFLYHYCILKILLVYKLAAHRLLLLNVFCNFNCQIRSSKNYILRTYYYLRLMTAHDFRDVLACFFSLLKIKLLQTFMKLIYVRDWLVYNGFSVVFAKLNCKVAFL